MSQGKIYIVSTPIGNLGDLSARAIETLKSVSLIASEDTRTSGILLKHFGISAPLTSYHEHNEAEKAEELIGKIMSGLDIAVISEAGTPLISDPGYRVIKAAVDHGITVVPIPGACAATTALSVSGLPTDRFVFCGFLPDKKGKRVSKLQEVAGLEMTLVFYISKWKVGKVLEDMIEVLGDRRACYCRELTKLHEEIRHTTLKGLIDGLDTTKIKGEITLVVEGNIS